MEKTIYPRRLFILSIFALFISFLIRIYIPGSIIQSEFPMDFEEYNPIISGFAFSIFLSLFLSYKVLPKKKKIFLNCFPEKFSKTFVILTFLIVFQLIITIMFGVIQKTNINISSGYLVFTQFFNYLRNILSVYILFYSLINFKKINNKEFLKALILLSLSLIFDLITGARSRILNWYLLPCFVYFSLFISNFKRLFFLLSSFPLFGIIILRFGSLIQSYSTLDLINRINIFIPMIAAKNSDFSEVLSIYPFDNTFFPMSLLGLIPAFLINRPLTNPGSYINEILFPNNMSEISFVSIGSFGEVLINQISNKGLFTFCLWTIIFLSFMFFINKSRDEFSLIILSFFLANNILNQLEDYFAIRFVSFIQFFVILSITQILIIKKIKFR